MERGRHPSGAKTSLRKKGEGRGAVIKVVRSLRSKRIWDVDGVTNL